MISSIEISGIVIVDSPVYCMGISGAMKNFPDHLGYRWFSHRPHPSMASKTGVAISTAAGR
jgi:NAD(P)H-dependent FMN reductase